MTEDAFRQCHRVLIHLSMGYPRVTGRLDTCYAPVRRSPSGKASFAHAAPRLACVKPIASVHPEPGSNSSLYIIFFIRLSLNSSFYCSYFLWRWYFITLYLYYIFVVFNLSKNLFPFLSKRTAKLRHFFELTKYFKKNIYFFFSNFCSFNSQATSLDCGCKVTAFSETTKIFLCFFWKFFVTRYILRRKILILSHFLCFFCRFLCFFRLFWPLKNMLKNIIFRDFGFFCVFSIIKQ